MKITNKSHYRLYYWSNGQVKKVPTYFRGYYSTEGEAISDLELYWKLNRGKKYLIKQFLLVHCEESYTSKIIKIIDTNV